LRFRISRIDGGCGAWWRVLGVVKEGGVKKNEKEAAASPRGRNGARQKKYNGGKTCLSIRLCRRATISAWWAGGIQTFSVWAKQWRRAGRRYQAEQWRRATLLFRRS